MARFDSLDKQWARVEARVGSFLEDDEFATDRAELVGMFKDVFYLGASAIAQSLDQARENDKVGMIGLVDSLYELRKEAQAYLRTMIARGKHVNT